MKEMRMNDLVTIKISTSVRVEVERIARQRESGMSEVVRNYLIDGLRRDGVQV
jgi:hypothetical protein